MAASTTRRRKRWFTWRHATRRAGDRYDRIWFHASSLRSATRDYVVYDDKLRPLNETAFNYDDQMVFAPHVLMCEFADTDSDNVIESFTKTRPFHVDRRGKDGILEHTDPKHDMPEDADTPTDA